MADPLFSTNHLTLDINVYYYKAPRNRPVRARTIANGQETVELVTRGRGSFDGHSVSPGHFMWLYPGDHTINASDSESPYECLVINFPVKWSLGRQIRLMSVWNNPDAVHRFADELLTTCHHGSTDQSLLCHYAYTRLLWISHRYSQDIVIHDQLSPAQKARHYIDAHYMSQITIDQVAVHAGISSSYLHAQFKEEFKTSPHQYIINRRFEEARHLLAGDRYPLRDITSICGFTDVPNFCRAFKKRYGLTPAQFRAGTASPLD
jgi:AraC-like DNA-binding protein